MGYNASMTYYTRVDSPTGNLLLIGDKGKLTQVSFASTANLPDVQPDWTEDKTVFTKAIDQLRAYFNGKLQQFDLELDFNGTDFQQAVWKELLKIPYGKLSNYQTIASNIGRPKAVRAVGNAIGKNPICIITPCHRVIASNGTLGGFSGGLDNKRVLLQLEANYSQPV
jgi:methylated-DNA-[protein]-cysteine S-methyltransferase